MQFLTSLVLCVVLIASSKAQGKQPTAPRRSDTLALVSIGAKGLDEIRRQAMGKVLVVNLWATWCTPCVEEFPDLVALHRRYADKGLDVVFVSVDDDDAKTRSRVLTFLRRMKVQSPAYFKKGGDDEAFINAVNPKWSGALPTTLVYARDGNLVAMKVEQTNLAQLEQTIKPLLR